MAGLSMRNLGFMFLTLTLIYVVSAQRIREDVVKSGRCTTGFNPGKNVCYLYDPKLTKQPLAQQACEAKGGTLAALDTEDTADFVEKAIYTQFTEHFCAWIGYNKNSAQWYDGSDFNWTKWKSGEPNKDHERCTVVVNSDYRWKDLGCLVNCHSICQLPERALQAYAREEEAPREEGNMMVAMMIIEMPPRSEKRAESKIRCALYCLQDPLCGKFNFNPQTLRCALYNEADTFDKADGSQTFIF